MCCFALTVGGQWRPGSFQTFPTKRSPHCSRRCSRRIPVFLSTLHLKSRGLPGIAFTELFPTTIYGLEKAWASETDASKGIIDHLVHFLQFYFVISSQLYSTVFIITLVLRRKKYLDAMRRNYRQSFQREAEGSEISATLYVASQGRLILGRTDGSIILISAPQTMIKELLQIGAQRADGNVSFKWLIHNEMLCSGISIHNAMLCWAQHRS